MEIGPYLRVSWKCSHIKKYGRRLLFFGLIVTISNQPWTNFTGWSIDPDPRPWSHDGIYHLFIDKQSINRDIYFGVIIRYVHIIVCINNSIQWDRGSREGAWIEYFLSEAQCAFLHKLCGFLQTDMLKRPLLLHPVKLFVHISTVDLSKGLSTTRVVRSDSQQYPWNRCLIKLCKNAHYYSILLNCLYIFLQ